MRRLSFALALPALLLAGCQVRDASNDNGAAANGADIDANADIENGLDTIDAQDNSMAMPAQGNVMLPAGGVMANGNDMQSAPTPSASATYDRASGISAQDVAQRYYSAITAGDYAEARSLWADNGKASGKSPDDFAKQFDRYSSFQADIGQPGAATPNAQGSTVRIPVTLHGTLRGGASAFRTKATVVLQRMAGAKPAGDASTQWRITQIEKPQGTGS